MPQIIVTTARSSDREESVVMLNERVTVADFESDHFAAQLVERLGWAVGDAHAAERAADDQPSPEGDSTPAAPDIASAAPTPNDKTPTPVDAKA